MSKAAVALAKRADSRIRLLRGQKIILDSDLAELYGVLQGQKPVIKRPFGFTAQSQ